MPTSSSNTNIAQLLYQVGVSVNMNYGPTSSGASPSLAVTSLITYFSYNPTAYYAQKNNYTPTVWDNMLITELNNDRPLLYIGYGTGGHGFVCDGYDDNYSGSLYFHFNWGWSGAYNGYFHLTSLTPGTYSFTNNQAAGFGIQPLTTNVPNSDFTSDIKCPCVGNTVYFYDQSTDGPDGWNWSNSGGTPSSSTTENPSIVYNTAGFYDVSLTASNVSGSGNTETKTNYISVYNAPLSASCMPSTTSIGNYWYGVLNVSLNDLNHSSGDTYADGGCMDFTCQQSTTLTPGSTYNMDVTVRVGTTGNAHTSAYIDFNNNGDLTDAGECIFSNEISSSPSSSNTFTKSITMPSNPTISQLLRMRVITDYPTITGPCSDPYIGQSEDYGVYFMAIPPAPVATTATSITQTSFDANWNSSSGANGYYFDVATDNGFTNFVSGFNNLDVGNVTTYNVPSLNVNTDYYYRVRAYNTNGTSGNSNTISLTTLSNIPSPPNAAAATNISQTFFDANWDASSGADGYYLDVATDNGFINFVSGFNNLDVGNVTTYNVTGLNSATDYYYRLRAYNTDGTSGNSNVITVTTLPYSPSPPNASAATNISQTFFDANWDASTGADGYYLDVATDNGFTSFVSGFSNLDVGNVTTYNVTSLSSATDYYYRLRAYNTGGTSGTCNVITVTTLPYSPAPPNATAATNISQSNFYANWDVSSGADGYYLDVTTDNGFTSFVSGFNNLDVGNVITYNVFGLNSNTDYFYRLRAYNTGGTSGNSNVISLTTLKDIPAPPVATSATNTSQTAFDANWDLSTDADGYYLDVATDNGFTNFVSGFNNLDVGNVTTYNITSLSSATDYYYRLRAYNTGGTSGNSNVITVTTLPYSPAPPNATAATNISQTDFDANWDASTATDGYYLDVATDNGFTNFVSDFNNLDVGNVTTYFVDGLNPETDYYYRVRAYNNGGSSGNSNVINVTTQPSNPGAPVALPATNITQASFNANWNPVGGANSYWLDVATDNGFTNFVSGYDNLDVGNVTTYPVSGLNPFTDYFYRLRAENVSGTSGNSNVISLTTLKDIPAPPVATSATNISQTAFDANWNLSTDADGYYLDVATDNGFTNFVSGFNNLDVGNVTMYNAIGLNPETVYFYRLRGYNAAGTSGNSNVINLTTLTTDIGEFGNIHINMFVSNNFICIGIDGMKEVRGEVTIYNLLGAPLLYKQLKNTKVNNIYLNVPDGIYIIKLLINKKIYTRKLFISVI